MSDSDMIGFSTHPNPKKVLNQAIMKKTKERRIVSWIFLLKFRDILYRFYAFLQIVAQIQLQVLHRWQFQNKRFLYCLAKPSLYLMAIINGKI